MEIFAAFPFAGLAAVIYALSHLVNATANYKRSCSTGVTLEDVKLLQRQSEARIMRLVRRNHGTAPAPEGMDGNYTG